MAQCYVQRKDNKLPKAKGWYRTSAELLAHFESQILSLLRSPFRLDQIPLSRANKPEFESLKNEFINTLEIHPDRKPDSNPPLVMMHG